MALRRPDPEAPAVVSGSSPGRVQRFPAFESRRLRLRPLNYAYVQDLLALDGHEAVTGLLLDARLASPEQASAAVMVARGVARDCPGLGVWATEDHQRRFLGITSLMPVQGENLVELGARYLPAAWGNFYALEAGRVLIAHGFKTLGLERIGAFVHPDNRAPMAVLRRLGFQQQGLGQHFGQPALRFELSA